MEPGSLPHVLGTLFVLSGLHFESNFVGGQGGSGRVRRYLSGRRQSDACQVPVSWEGDWFEYGERRPVQITPDGNITHKGECVYKKGDKYVFKDRNQNCFRCAVMHLKHDNVIQYKESFCESNFNPRRPTDLCYDITADSPLRSLFRLNGQTSPCPIQGSYSLTYSRGLGLCEYPKSSISQCSDKSHLVFRYQACADIPRSESSVEELRCLGSWKEGSTFYFLGLMNHSRVNTDDWEGRFRCFAYQKIYDGFLLSQSGEALCNLYSAKEGDRTMTLKRVYNHEETCSLPRWLLEDHHQFQNLNQTMTYHFNQPGTSLTVTSLEEQTERKLKCNTIVDDRPMEARAKVVMQVNFECESGFLCMDVEKKSPHILSLRMGRLSRNRDEACNPHLFFDVSSDKTTLISSKHYHSRCPLVGKYLIRTGLGLSSGSLAIQSGQSFTNCQNNLNHHASQQPSRSGWPSLPRDYLIFGCSGDSKFQLRSNQLCDERKTSANVGDTSSNPGNGFESGSDYLNEQSIQDFSCHGGWFEPSPRSVDHALMEQSAGPMRDAQGLIQSKSRMYGDVASAQYLIISPHQRASNSPRRLCALLTPLDLGEKNVTLIAKAGDCPSNPYGSESSRKGDQREEEFFWNFQLERASECAQALATANSGVRPRICQCFSAFFVYVSVYSRVLW
ncbi:hypothetical protein TCAL_11427 [Tigriopus californicus]|uniref:Uncharacterized protein n=1 Tax=Tigriopus californicus TaxID=6832 RepID=A0A553PAY6_TIGCA|nr:uncharacterized protein LOC131893381 [Tigriopus californicus]TRY74844.1 hypothetical protein TCAL_11427 [Tigriopus californicus]